MVKGIIVKIDKYNKNDYTINEIEKQINTAKRNQIYVKFIMPMNKYISIIYNRDYTIEFATNIYNAELYNQMNVLRKAWTQSSISAFILRWITRLVK